ncbi:MAG TPA: helix-turn-helix domain-containing protein, partial [Anaeromyxobacteraceae bacterium]|nr:helix-turn-helix domain-containing protein [Anaeromyxobacteraceae bacterium]
EAAPPSRRGAGRAGDPGRQEAERLALEAHVAHRRWNLARVAADLGVSRMTLYKRLERHGLRRPR